MADATAARIWKRLAIAAVASFFVGATRFVGASEPGLDWDTAISKAFGPHFAPIRTSVADHFGAVPYSNPSWWKGALAAGGRKFETAGVKFLGVHDAVHHISAASLDGTVRAEAVFLCKTPRFPMPSRDLSKVESARGLALGISPDRAAAALGVSDRAVKSMDSVDSILYVRNTDTCGSKECWHEGTVIFRHGRAVVIAFADIGS